MPQIYFWEKLARLPEREEKDPLIFNIVEEDLSIRDVIRELEERNIGKDRKLNELNPPNSSVKRWVKSILNGYPKKNNGEIEDLLNAFRECLRTRSREKEKFIVGILQLKDVIILAQTRKDTSLAEFKEGIHSVKTVFSPKNIIRADIIKKDNGDISFKAFESNYRLSKSHANFWGIEPEDVGWDSLGNVTLIVQLDRFEYPIQLPIEREEIEKMMKTRLISSTGKIKIGQESGKIMKANLYGKSMSFSEFNDFYISETQKLDHFRKQFKMACSSLKTDIKETQGYFYEENITSLNEITTKGKIERCKKQHPRYSLAFFTKQYPGIRPSNDFLNKISQAIFNNRTLDLCHVGEKLSDEPFKIGSLYIYNQVKFSEGLKEFLNSLLNKIQDADGKKTKAILQYVFNMIYYENIKNVHLRFLFESINNEFIIPDIEFEFSQNLGYNGTEGVIEFKSSDDLKGNPSRFAEDKLIPEIKKYLKNGNLEKYCILYGIEDNTDVSPIHNLGNDQIQVIEKKTNKELKDLKVKIKAHSVPVGKKFILAILLIPSENDQ